MDLNVTTSMDEERHGVGDQGFASIAVKIVYILVGLSGVFGNALVLVVIILVRDLHDVANILIGNQSLIDLLTSLLLLATFVAPLPPMPDNNPTLARFLCAFLHTKYPFWSLIVASSLNLTVMTLERYYAVVFPIHYYSRTKSIKLNCLVAFPWVVGFAFQQTLMWISKVEDGSCLQFIFPNGVARIAFGLGALILEFLLPIVVMLFVYTRIFKKLKKSIENRRTRSSRSREETNDLGKNADKLRYRARRNAIKVLLMVSICFIICWTLNMILYQAYSFGFPLDFEGPLYTLSVFICFGNKSINPLIYSFQYRRLQKGLRKVFCRWTAKDGSNISNVPSRTVSGTF